MTVLHGAEGIVWKTTSNPKLCLNIKQKCSANKLQASIMFYKEYYNTTN